MKQTWANPSPAGGKFGRKGNLFTDVIFVDSKVAPLQSPAPAPFSAGNLAGIVPAGYVEQIGNDGEVDTLQQQVSGAYLANITQFVYPYFTGGWPSDPQSGQPGHTQQRPTGQG